MNFLLKFIIIQKFKSQTLFARECGRNDSWLSRLITGRQLPTKEEKEQIREKLNIRAEDIDLYFGN